MAKIENLVSLEGFCHGLGVFEVKQGRKTLEGVIDTDGNIVVEPQWEMVHIGDCDTVVLGDSRKVQYFSLGQQKFLPGPPVRGRMITWRGRKKGLEDMEGNIIIPHAYKRLEYADDNCRYLLAQNFKGKFGLFNDTKELLPVVYDEITCGDVCSPCAVRQGDDWFLVRSGGERVSDKRYDWLGPIRNSYAIYGEKYPEVGKTSCMHYGLIDIDEKIVIPAKYEHLAWLGDERLSCGEATHAGSYFNPAGSWQTWKYGIIDCADNIVVPQIYPMPLRGGVNGCYRAEYFDPRTQCTMEGIIDENNNEVIPFYNWSIWNYDSGYRIYDREEMQYALYSSSGKELLPFEYERMEIGDTLDYIAVCKNGEWYYVNQHGERVLL